MLALVPVMLVYRAAPRAAALVRQVPPHGPLEEALAAWKMGIICFNGNCVLVCPCFGCCTADSQTGTGRHRLYNNGLLVLFPLLENDRKPILSEFLYR